MYSQQLITTMPLPRSWSRDNGRAKEVQIQRPQRIAPKIRNTVSFYQTGSQCSPAPFIEALELHSNAQIAP